MSQVFSESQKCGDSRLRLSGRAKLDSILLNLEVATLGIPRIHPARSTR
jgi:hypothetical protein